MNDILNQIKNKEKSIAVIGLGYVGLPIALEFASSLNVIGFDINKERLTKLKNGIDPNNEITSDEFNNKNIEFTSDINDLRKAVVFIVAVPTPIDDSNQPDLTPLLKASETVGKVLKSGEIVIYESTVYPGCTEEDCVPVLEKYSGLKFRDDFKVGYSPERINPGDKVHTLTNTVKIVSGCDDESLSFISSLYEIIIKAGVHRASNIKVAEAGKIIENTQRDVNIALMNELSIICSRIGINTYEVLEAAGTKWNFLKFYPGLVGGHCIGVDPYYLVHKAHKLKYHPQIINAGRYVNDTMGGYIAKKTVKTLIKTGRSILSSKVLILGFTFKEDVTDIRNTKVLDIYKELLEYGVHVEINDPKADPEEVKIEYGIDLISNINNNYDAIIVAVSHKDFLEYDESYFKSKMNENALLVDLKGIYRSKINNINYWSL